MNRRYRLILGMLRRSLVGAGFFAVLAGALVVPGNAANATSTGPTTSSTTTSTTRPAAGSASKTTTAVPTTAPGPSTTAKPVNAAGVPSVSLAFKEIAIGSIVSLRIGGFTAKVVTIMVCGNEGRRGSSDCDLAGAKTVDVTANAKFFLTDFTMTSPPAPCPCIVQVASERFDEVAVAAFTLLNHPTAPVVENGTGSIPLQLSVVSEPADDGIIGRARTSLAGSTWYDVTVIVQNTSASVVKGTVLTVEVGRNTEDQIRRVVFPEVGDIEPRATWRETVRVRLPTPVYGTFVWRATTTVFGLSTTATTTTRNQPTLLFVLVAIFGIAVLALIVRLVTRLVRRIVRGRRQVGVSPLGATS